MIRLFLTARDGRKHEVETEPGVSLMEAIRDAGVEDEFALCGGCCSCCTCHVYIDSAQHALLQPMAANEADLLEFSDARRPESRLSCQIPIEEAFNGLRVIVAPED